MSEINDFGVEPTQKMHTIDNNIWAIFFQDQNCSRSQMNCCAVCRIEKKDKIHETKEKKQKTMDNRQKQMSRRNQNVGN